MTVLPSDRQIINARKKFKSITILWPGDTRVPTIRGKWQRMKDGRVLATYTPDELEQCLKISEALDEDDHPNAQGC